MRATLSTILLILVFSVARGGVILVPTDQPTIQAGIDVAAEGDTVLVADGTYTGVGNRDVDFDTLNIVLMSENGPDSTTLDCEGELLRCLILDNAQDSTTVIQGFTIKNADVGIWGSFSATLSNLKIQGCETGMSLLGGEPELIDVALSGNASGILCEGDGALELVRCDFIGNFVGLLLYEGSAELDSCLFRNSVESGIRCEDGSAASCRNCTFKVNEIAVESYFARGHADLDSCLLDSNVTAVSGDCRADSTVFSHNIYGIKRVFYSATHLTDCLFEYVDTVLCSDGFSDRSLALRAAGEVGTHLMRTEIRDCGAVADMIGGTDGDIEALFFDSCYIHDNSGGLHCQLAALYMHGCEYTNNGGGVEIETDYFHTDNISVTSSTISDNGSAGLKVEGLGQDLYIADVVLTGNTGPGLHVGSGAFTSVVLERCTVADNLSDGVRIDEDSLSLLEMRVSVIADNEGYGIYCSSSPKEDTITCCNVVGNSSGGWGVIPNEIGVDGNISEEPLFCDASAGDYTLFDISPCASAYSSCSTLIGALGIGCYAPLVDGVIVDTVGDSLHVLSDQPVISWSYVDSSGQPQTMVELEVGTDDDWAEAELWNPDSLLTPDTLVVYAGDSLVDGQTCFLRLRVSNDLIWSEWFETSFHVNTPPSAPGLLCPDNWTVTGSHPILWVLNSEDNENDLLTYDFTGFHDTDCVLGGPIEVLAVPEGIDSTGGEITGDPLGEHCLHWWNARSFDGFEYSEPSETGTFVVNELQEAPSTPLCRYPPTRVDSIEYTAEIHFIWDAAIDPDVYDTVRYRLTLDTLDDFSTARIVDSLESNEFFWVDTLAFNKRFWWKVAAWDRTGNLSVSPESLSFWTWTLGDVDHSHLVTMSDLTVMIDHLFISLNPLDPMRVGDLDGDCRVAMADLTLLIDHLFISLYPLTVIGCDSAVTY